MNYNLQSIFSKREHIISLLLVLSVIVFIAFLFPTNGRFNLEYDKGDIWKHNDLLAPFEFPLLKNPQEVIRIKNEVRKNLTIRFRKTKNAGTVQDKVTKYLTEIKSEIGNASFQKLLRYLKENRAKILISKDQMTYLGLEKESFLIPEKETLIKYSDSKYVDINDYHTFIVSKLPEDYHEELDKLIAIEAELDKKNTKKALETAEQKGITSNVIVRNGELVVSKGNLITNSIYQKLQSLEDAFAKRQITFTEGIWTFMGHIILTFLILGALMLYLFFHFRSILQQPKELSFILFWIVIFTFLVFQIEKTPNLSSYMIPFCIAPIVIKTYYEERLALFVHIVIVLIASFLSTLDYEFTFLQILAGIVTVLLIEETRYWDRFFLSILIIIGTYYLGFLGLNMASTNTIGQDIDSSVLMWLGVNGILILLAYPIIPLFSRIFGFTSNITLMELSDLNKPLLKDLSISAPGTFQHSLQVSNLSEAAAEKIGANSLLIKVAALYHDIGKLKEPMIFIENLGYGKNPHDELTNFESTRKIIAHIPEGVKLAKTYKLPKEIMRMIETHHGTTRVEFFYRKQLTDFPHQEFDESIFRYSGPKPITKEETILLLADSIEAASKSLKEPTAQNIDDLVENITLAKIKNKQLSDSKMTYQEMVVCKNVFKDLLKSINHVRVQYPDEQIDAIS
ncbi:MAG: HDIG domain-containing metalloprotein [Saprospiraceae bacterium]